MKGKSRNFVQNPFSSLPTPLHPTPLSPADCTFNVIFGSNCFVLFYDSHNLLSIFYKRSTFCVWPLLVSWLAVPMLHHVPCSRDGQDTTSLKDNREEEREPLHSTALSQSFPPFHVCGLFRPSNMLITRPGPGISFGIVFSG